MLFNKNNNGAFELRKLLGFIDAATNFDKWITWLRLSQRQTISLVGNELYQRAEDHYESSDYTFQADNTTEPEQADVNDQLVLKFQLAIALFAYVKMIPSIDAGHGNGGRRKIGGSEERSLTAVEAYKDEQNILNLAYEALEDLINFAEEKKLEEWQKSPLKAASGNLLITGAVDFNMYYPINSSRLYFTLVPMMKEVQDRFVAPILTRNRLSALIEAKTITKEERTEEQNKLISLIPDICRPLALATIVLALKRLPIEIFPEGLVQTQIVGTVKEKQIASERTRLSMIDSLTDDAQAGFTTLQLELDAIYNPDAERYVMPPKAEEGVKGFLF